MRFSSFLPALAISLVIRAENITPRVGGIEVYGARKVSIQKIKTALGATDGGLMPSREDAEDRISKIPGVLAARVEAACCEARKMILYVGVEERDSPHFEYRPDPTGEVALPPGLFQNYQTFLDLVSGSMHAGSTDEDLTNGYSLMADPQCRELQKTFIPAVATNLALVDKALRESNDSEQRAAAAYLLQYGPRDVRSSKVIADDLQYALQDADDSVRENAMHALKSVAVGARLHPEQEIHIAPTWFVELMNSVVWSDRRNASLALVNLTEKRDPEALAILRDRALTSVLEMARWHDLQHALPAFILAGRLAGLSEPEIQTAWVDGDREAVLEKALHPNGKRSLLESLKPSTKAKTRE